MWPTVFRVLTSRTGIAVIVIGALFTWHQLDKSSAIRRTVVRYVADVELAAAEAENKSLREQAARLAAANRTLLLSAQDDEKEIEDVKRTHREYLEAHPTSPDCAPDADFFDLLQSN